MALSARMRTTWMFSTATARPARRYVAARAPEGVLARATDNALLDGRNVEHVEASISMRAPGGDHRDGRARFATEARLRA